ncbi:MAG TPA: biotin/lipoyl-containing protein [Candidatus Limnocylindria bacterium]|jgi:biotin carboxyl carrier protein
MTDQPDALEAISLAADELVPQLAERLRTHGLAEIEVSRGELRLRVTATPDAPAATARPAGDAVRGAGEPMATGGSPGAIGTTESAGSVGVASPAVGYFVYADGLGPGLEVARGDALGHVEMLGVRHDVRAPRGGTVRHLVAEAGEAVEYGQVVLELDPTASAA